MPVPRSTVGPFKDFLRCYYGDVGPLFMTSFTDEGNIQDLARYKFPHADSQSIEPMGRQPVQISGEMVFYTSLDKDCYPKRYIELRDVLAKRDGQWFVHPLHGQYFGYMSRFVTTHVAEERNGCKVSFSFEETTTDEIMAVVQGNLDKDPLSTAEQSAAVADVGLADLGVSTPAGMGTFTEQVQDWRGFLGNEELQAGEVTSKLSDFRVNIGRVIEHVELADARNYEVYRAVRQLSASIVAAAEQAQSNAVNLIEFRLEFDSTPAELAIEYYKDAGRAPRIVSLNPCRYFFYPRGTLIRIPDR